MLGACGESRVPGVIHQRAEVFPIHPDQLLVMAPSSQSTNWILLDSKFTAFLVPRDRMRYRKCAPVECAPSNWRNNSVRAFAFASM
jgi:hypothetical protein